jgi:hypothetical protein
MCGSNLTGPGLCPFHLAAPFNSLPSIFGVVTKATEWRHNRLYIIGPRVTALLEAAHITI